MSPEEIKKEPPVKEAPKEAVERIEPSPPPPPSEPFSPLSPEISLPFGRLFSFFGSQLKKTKFGKKLLALGGKLLQKSSVVLQVLPTAWKILKKFFKRVGQFLLAFLIWAAQYGIAALTGLLAGAIVGSPFAIKAGISAFTATTAATAAFLGPAAPLVGVLVGVIVGVIVEVIFVVSGTIGGILAKVGFDTLGLERGGVRLGQAASNLSIQTSEAVGRSGGRIVASSIGGFAFLIILAFAFFAESLVAPDEELFAPPGESPYIEVIKTVYPEQLANEQLDADLHYSISISPTEETIQITSILNHTMVINDNPFEVIRDKDGNPITSFICLDSKLEPGEDCIIEYIIEAKEETDEGQTFKDSLVSDTITVTADIPAKDLTGEAKSDSASVIIGSPPEDCPRGWPVDWEPVKITQGPDGTFSHEGDEAIDIAGDQIDGATIRATHAGRATKAGGGCSLSDGGCWVEIEGYCCLTRSSDGSCQKMQQFSTYYGHLYEEGMISGPVRRGDTIGYANDSGSASTGSHLHYHFKPYGIEIRMEENYIPADIPRGNYCGGGRYSQEPPCWCYNDGRCERHW